LLGCLIAQACCLPAFADEPTPADRETQRRVAAALSVGMPWVLFGGLQLLPRPAGKEGSLVVLFPFGAGAGQAYAGDLVRGALVGGGGLVVFFATLGIANQLSRPYGADVPMYLAYAAAGLYGLLAGWDAYNTVDRAEQLVPTTMFGPPTGGPPTLPLGPQGG
jgi:hypothetical protein